MSRSQESAGKHVGAGARSELVALGKRFARFRKEHRRGTRIPDDLRMAALQLLREVAPADVYRTCGISFGQVMAWKEAEEQGPESADVRVFSVVGGEPVAGLAPRATASAVAPELELRLGPWSVSVRLSEPVGRG